MQTAFFRNRWIVSLIFWVKEKLWTFLYSTLEPYICDLSMFWLFCYIVLRRLVQRLYRCLIFHILSRCNRVMVKILFLRIFVRCSLCKVLSNCLNCFNQSISSAFKLIFDQWFMGFTELHSQTLPVTPSFSHLLSPILQGKNPTPTHFLTKNTPPSHPFF